ncbi:uncharacterized protein BDV17DRAFT_191461 [Aspergillus undulatus]|uniref:uncharacterized protein n=1 Tax=Aspergillus undulatus TaxID=1810928 RepID=UPI003CCDB1C3
MTKWRFLHPLDSIRDALVKPSAAAKEQEHCLMGIDTIYHTVAQLKAPFIDPANLQALMIDVLPLLEEGQNEMGMCMVFFRPWPVARLRMHPILLSNPEVARAVRISMEGMDHGPPSLQRYGFPLDSRVRILANAFVHHVQSRPRSAPDGQVHESLASITGWVHHEGYTPQFEADTASDPEWACNGGWTQPGDGNDDGAGDEKTPHIKAVMFSVIDGDVDGGGGEERLLRGEVLTILGIIAERLRIESLKRRGHLVIPVRVVPYPFSQSVVFFPSGAFKNFDPDA